MQDTSSILAQDDTTFNAGQDEVKQKIRELVADGSAEAKDELVQLGKDHGVNVTPDMSFEQIREQFAQSLV